MYLLNLKIVFIYLFIDSGMDLLTWPNIVLDQFHELVPQLKHLEPSLRERIMIEGLFCSFIYIYIYIYKMIIFKLFFLGRYKPFLKRQELEVAALKRDEHLKLDVNLDYLQ